MTGPAADHGVFDELAAGHALNALEPEDEQRFLAHAGHCPRCGQLTADFRDAAAAVAEATLPAEPGGRLEDRIVAMALADLGQPDRPAGWLTAAATRDGVTAGRDAPGPGVVPPRHRRARRWQRPAAAAAAALLIAGGGIWAGLAAAARGSPQPQLPLAACAHPGACTEVVLTASATHKAAAKVIIRGGVAWLEPAAISANSAGEIYVLWQITGAHTPLPVGSFDIRPGAHAPVRIGGLAAPYRGTWAFAVSLEHGRTIPASPSEPVALGQVS